MWKWAAAFFKIQSTAKESASWKRGEKNDGRALTYRHRWLCSVTQAAEFTCQWLWQRRLDNTKETAPNFPFKPWQRRKWWLGSHRHLLHSQPYTWHKGKPEQAKSVVCLMTCDVIEVTTRRGKREEVFVGLYESRRGAAGEDMDEKNKEKRRRRRKGVLLAGYLDLSSGVGWRG